MRVAVLTIAGILLTSACATPSYVGDGPVSLSPAVRAYYEEYRRQVNPLAFAVSPDGRAAGYSACPQFGGCRGNEISSALASCQRSGRKCFIYDMAGTVVWQGATTSTRAAPAHAADGGGRNPI
jgi:hypothetical protein